MIVLDWSILALGGLIAGVLAGFLGIGGGAILVPLLVALGYTPIQAVATSTLAILVTSASGSLQNWWMGYFKPDRILYLALPALITAQLGAFLAGRVLPYVLLGTFALLQLSNVYLVELRRNLQSESPITETAIASGRKLGLARVFTGGLAGFLAGFFGVGGGVVLVPLQIVLLGETIKPAVRNSLGVICVTAISACIGHAIEGNILLFQGIVLGSGGILGAQIGTRYLPKFSDRFVKLTFRGFLGTLSLYMFWQSWRSYRGF